MDFAAVVAFPLESDIVVVFGIVFAAVVLFVFEPLPVDVSAIAILVVLVVLEPWTQVSPELGLSGFANPATVTVLAMFILSRGIERTGAVRTLGDWILAHTGDDERKQLAATIGIAGPTAGFVNNTPIVAMLIPMVTDLADRTGTSPSTLLIPLSYAAMLGGMLTLVGTSPNLLASDISGRLVGRSFTMFEFTQLGVIVLLTGAVYLLTVGHRLVPERIDPDADLANQFELKEYVASVRIPSDSPYVGETVGELEARVGRDVEVLRILRRGKIVTKQLRVRTLRADDRLLIRSSRHALLEIVAAPGLQFADVLDDDELPRADPDEEPTLTEVIVVPESAIASESMTALEFRRRFDSPILAIRRQGELLEQRLATTVLRGGDTVLAQTTRPAREQLMDDPNFVLAQEVERPSYRRPKVPIAVGIVALVVGLAALGPFPIVVTALAGVVAMVLTGCVRPDEVYDAVDWNVIFLLAGVIPLGISMERTGAAELLAHAITPLADVVPLVVFVMVFYMLTAILTEVITNLASVALMLPIAVDVATEIGADPFSFVLVVTFASSTALMTPVGYQTNLMVYGRGGYRFTDFLRVGFPLQVVLAVVTALGIATFWGF
ncbi:SLC13 family permease [Natrarchaeobaculum aegyptiacum]|uniref:SLC13 family permease n=1 Tax=Natrarchaeobaculum aegyptiacum TaxID=745377 RepID=A0A2Z2HUX1_9EURY|nr:SLC13 family permease [Natrarchaeobaculum aegyptiacum]ARS90991.1 SLC13 family permease [Natrarchaeobaculum aegyptiacum]